MASHNLELGLRLSHRVALLLGGRLAYSAPSATLDPAALEAEYRRHLAVVVTRRCLQRAVERTGEGAARA